MFRAVVGKVRSNWKSGLTVSLVSIPLSVSLAVAAGSTPTAGIITALWAGLVAAILGGSCYNVVGPTGALSGVLAAYALVNGYEGLAMVSILAGFLILLAYFAGFEKYLVLIPATTIHGFTLGVAFIIALNQMNFAFGLTDLPKHERFIDNVIESFANLGKFSYVSLAVFAVSFFIATASIRRYPRVPAVAVVAALGIFLGYLSVIGIVTFKVLTLDSIYSDISPVIFRLPVFFFSNSIATTAVTVALVAILETMMSARIADVMTKTRHDKRREMLGLSIANIASGITGGIPATAALARTSLNIKSGANSRASGILNAVFVGIISLFFLGYFKYLPLAVIAAILVRAASGMVERAHFERMLKFDRKDFVISGFVAVLTVYIDPIVGIFSGAIVSLLVIVQRLTSGSFDLSVVDLDRKIVKRIYDDEHGLEAKSPTLVYSIKGHLTYLDSQSHVKRFESEGNYKNVIIRMREAYIMDLDGSDAFNEIVNSLKGRGKKVLVTGVNPLIYHAIKSSSAFQQLEKEGHVFQRTADALVHLGMASEKAN